MRKALMKLDPKKTYIFVGVYHNVESQQRLCIREIRVYENNFYLGMINHNNVARKPFQKFENENGIELQNGDKIRFTGKVKPYIRANTSKDYGIIQIKMKKVVD